MKEREETSREGEREGRDGEDECREKGREKTSLAQVARGVEWRHTQ